MSDTLVSNLVVILALTAPGWAMFCLLIFHLINEAIIRLVARIEPPKLEIHPSYSHRFADFEEVCADPDDLRQSPHYFEVTNAESPCPMFVRRIPDSKYDKLEP